MHYRWVLWTLSHTNTALHFFPLIFMIGFSFCCVSVDFSLSIYYEFIMFVGDFFAQTFAYSYSIWYNICCPIRCFCGCDSNPVFVQKKNVSLHLINGLLFFFMFHTFEWSFVNVVHLLCKQWCTPNYTIYSECERCMHTVSMFNSNRSHRSWWKMAGRKWL